MKKNVGFKNNNLNNSINAKRLSLHPKNKKVIYELNTNSNLKGKEMLLKSEDYTKNNQNNKSIDNKNVRNKYNNIKKKNIKKFSNKNSSSKLKEINCSEEQQSFINKPNGCVHNYNKNNSMILTNIENIYNESNIENNNSSKEEISKNKDSKRHKNDSYCNIKVNKPTKLILDPNITLNDISKNKSVQINNKFASETHRQKKDLNRTFNNKENDSYITNFRFNNKEKVVSLQNKLDKNNEINKIQNNNLIKNKRIVKVMN